MELLLAVSSPAAADRSGRIRRAAAGISDWDAAMAAAREHRLDGFLADALWTSARDQVPASLQPQLAARLTSLALAFGQQLNLLNEIRTTLALAHIPSLPYKGPTLAMQLYARPFLRPARDLDVFVPPDRLTEAIQLLASGFQTEGPVGVKRELEHHRELRHRASGLLVEL
ncbi:MAG: nucleotidyltransferase family protein, partial [Gemmatimonadota bacterium]